MEITGFQKLQGLKIYSIQALRRAQADKAAASGEKWSRAFRLGGFGISFSTPEEPVADHLRQAAEVLKSLAGTKQSEFATAMQIAGIRAEMSNPSAESALVPTPAPAPSKNLRRLGLNAYARAGAEQAARTLIGKA